MQGLRPYWIPLAFLACALILALDPFPFASPASVMPKTPAWVTDPTPVRQPKTAPEYRVASFNYSCRDCHAILPSPAETDRTLTQHTEIELRHGLNTRCFNCHHRTNRNAFVDDQGGEIAWNQPQLLCARCHGPVYRDWQAGSHGRVNGTWDSRFGPQTRHKCIECHDPHIPPFRGLEPAPGPNTLRMGAPSSPSHEGERDPLRIYATGQPDPSQH